MSGGIKTLISESCSEIKPISDLDRILAMPRSPVCLIETERRPASIEGLLFVQLGTSDVLDGVYGTVNPTLQEPLAVKFEGALLA